MNQTNLPAVVQTAIMEQKIDLSQVNLVLPTETYGNILGEYDKLTMEVVKVDTDDTYEPGTRGKHALSQRPIMQMANAVGLIWDPERTTMLESTSQKSRAKATAAMRKPNNEWIILSEEKTIDMEVVEEEIRMGKEDDAEKGPIVDWKENERGKKYPVRGKWKNDQEKQAFIKRETRKAVLQYRKFKDERAMTGAKERVVRKLLALKPTYTNEELKKPFAFPRVLPDVNKMLANPEVRQAAIERMTGAASSIFGPSNGSRRERNVTPECQAIEEDAGLEIPASEVHEAPEEPLPTFDAPEEPPQEDSKEQAIRQRLQQYVDDSAYDILGKATSPAGKSARDLVKELLARTDATLDDLAVMDARVQDYLAKVGGGVS